MGDADQSGTEADDRASLPPDAAFAVLGNETRIAILQTLGDTDTPLSFTELRDRVGLRQGSKFNYHLDQLVGHFVQKTAAGYALREPGRRVVQAILSGAVTDDPTIEATEIEFPCRHCGEPIEVAYDEGKVRLSCPACGGNFDREVHPPVDAVGDPDGIGNLGNMSLPPAGVLDRSPAEVFRAAGTRVHVDALAASGGVCPRCSGRIEQSIADVCLDHDATTGICETCDHRAAVRVAFDCQNCIYEVTTHAVMALLDVPEVLVFVGEHGLDTTKRGIDWGWYYDEEILGTDPYEFRFTFDIDGDTLSLTVDEDLSVVSASRTEQEENPTA